MNLIDFKIAIKKNKYLRTLTDNCYRYLKYETNKSGLIKLFKLNISKWFCFEKDYDIKKTIIIDGVGRSGTTWLAEILSSYLNFRLIDEPFNPKVCGDIITKELYNTNVKSKGIIKYIPPDYNNNRYRKIFEWILSGRINNEYFNHANYVLSPKGRIIKSIRGSLFLKWIKNNFTNIPIIFIMRHPCAAVSSRITLDAFKKGLQLDYILKQSELINDHLKPYLEIIKNAKTEIQKNTCIWCIQNMIPLKTMENHDWFITTYENLLLDLKGEIKKILDYIGFNIDFKPKKVKNIPSRQVNIESAISKKINPLKIWKNRLSQDKINEIFEIVEKFSLDYIYNRNYLPCDILQKDLDKEDRR